MIFHEFWSHWSPISPGGECFAPPPSPRGSAPSAQDPSVRSWWASGITIIGYLARFCLKGVFIEILSAEPSWSIGFVVCHDVIIFHKNWLVIVLRDYDESMKDHSASQKGCGCSASFPGGYQVDGLPPAPSKSQSSHCFPSEASARRIITSRAPTASF